MQLHSPSYSLFPLDPGGHGRSHTLQGVSTNSWKSPSLLLHPFRISHSHRVSTLVPCVESHTTCQLSQHRLHHASFHFFHELTPCHKLPALPLVYIFPDTVGPLFRTLTMLRNALSKFSHTAAFFKYILCLYHLFPYTCVRRHLSLFIHHHPWFHLPQIALRPSSFDHRHHHFSLCKPVNSRYLGVHQV